MRAFLDWWVRQLSELLPSSLLKRAAGGSDAAILESNVDAVRLLIRRKGGIECAMEVRADNAGFRDVARMAASRRDMPQLLVLRFPGFTVLHKRLSLPLAAQSRLGALLRFEMDRETPFSPDEVYWDYHVRQRDVTRGRLDVDVAIIPKSAIAATLDTARAAGLDPAGIETDAEPGRTMLVRFSPPTFGQRLQSRRSVAVLAAAACLLALIAAAIPFIRQRQALATADATIASLTASATEAATLRKTIDQLSDKGAFFEKERSRTGDALSTMAALTRILPDDTYLTSLTLHDVKLTILGLSPSAANLIGLLAKASAFTQPTFTSPVLQNQGGSLEAFTIAVTLAAGAS